MQVFGSSGVRGVANDELTPEYVLHVAQAAGAVWEAERAALARDTRVTGQAFADAAAAGLASAGVDVDRLGEVPTPALQAYAEREGVPGMVVTASHNPPSYNGIKLFGADGIELQRPGLDRIEERLAAGAGASADWNEVGVAREVPDAAETYVEGLLEVVDVDGIAAAEPTVVVDPGHGAGVHTSPDFFAALGCTVHTVNADADGTFEGRDPEPIPDNLAVLAEHVRATDADLGIAHDGDADRAMFVDDTGSVIEGDAAMAALVADAVGEGDEVVAAVNVSQRVADAVEAAGADLTLTPIGSTNIVAKVLDLRAEGDRVPIAGEGNGGIIYPDYRVARDGAYTAARFLDLVAERPASEIADEHDDYANVRRSLAYDDEAERTAMLDAVREVAEGAIADLDTTDGWRLEYGDGWVLARPSGTEPVVRVYAEARTESRAAELADVFVEPVERVREGGDVVE